MVSPIKNHNIILLVIFAVTVISGLLLSADEYANLFTPLWLGNPPKEEAAGKGWRQSGCLPKTFAAADGQISRILTDRGFSEKHHTGKKQDMKRCKISLWTRQDHQIIVMLVEQGIGETLFSWGVIRNAK